jgi:hypothetical protein
MKKAVSSYGPPPRVRPESYPGENPGRSYFLLGACVLPLRPIPKRRLGQWRISDARTLEYGARGTEDLGPDCPLNYALLRANAAPIEERVPVLAVGSNSSPPQLVDKFSNVRPAIPVVRAWLRGLDTAFSAHVSRPGYVPAAVRTAGEAGQETPTFVTFLDADELSVMDRSEPNYERVTLHHPDGSWIIRLESGEELRACAAYRTKHGVLDFVARSDEGLLPQSVVRAHVEQRIAAKGAPAGQVGALVWPEGQGKRGLLLREIPEIVASGIVVPDGLEPFIAKASFTYGEVDSS